MHTAEREGTRLKAPSDMAIVYPLGAACLKFRLRGLAFGSVRYAGCSRYRTSKDSLAHSGAPAADRCYVEAGYCTMYHLAGYELKFGWNHERARPFADGLFYLGKTMDKGVNDMFDYGHEGEQIKEEAAMLLAAAVQRLYPGVRRESHGMASAGFYCDFDFGEQAPAPSLHGLAPIEEAMREIAEEKRMPIVFKLLNIAGAYADGKSDNAVLQRINGVSFSGQEELDAYLAWQEEAQKRDHRKLGKQLELFMFSEEAPGMPFYLPKGTVLRNELEQLAREQLAKFRYEEVRTPFIMNRGMWEQSGHFDHYRDNMYFSEIDRQHVAVKPMNCPGHMLMFKHKRHSYKELPIRYAEFGQVHRYEYSGALNGLFRVRTFCQDDGHIFATPDQIEGEIMQSIELIQSMYDMFGFSYSLELSTRPEQSMGSDEQWASAESALQQVLEGAGLPYALNPGAGRSTDPRSTFTSRTRSGATINAVQFSSTSRYRRSSVSRTSTNGTRSGCRSSSIGLYTVQSTASSEFLSNITRVRSRSGWRLCR